MPQIEWTVQNFYGPDYLVNIYHGESSGHVIIYVNSEIVIVDFEIFTDKTYSLCLDELFYNLHIIQNQPNYDYVLEINQEIIEHNNISKDKTNTKLPTYTYLFFGLLISLLIFFLLYLFYFK